MDDCLFDSIYTPHTLRRINKTINIIPKTTNDAKLVDIGCYAPMLSLYKDFLGYQNITAVAKYDWDALTKKCETANGTGISLKVLICDVEKENLEIQDNSVDVVLLLEVLEHFSIDPMKVMSEINRILKPNGCLVITTPNAIYNSLFLSFMLGGNPCGDLYNSIDSNRHNRLYTPNEIKMLANASGFDIDYITTINLSHNLSTRFIDWFMICVDLMNYFVGKRLWNARGNIILAKMIKVDAIRDRNPSWLYTSREIWKSWYKKVDNNLL